jgi:hypothetical protein
VTHKRFFAGCDPGLTGALALVDPLKQEIQVFDMPTFTVKVGKSERRRIDMHSIASWFDLYAEDIGLFTTEQVGPRPHDGATAAFNFGWAASAPSQAAACNRIPVHLVTPQKWKGAMHISTKDESRQLASRIAPQHAALWTPVRGVFDKDMAGGRAEAVLLAIYGSKAAA